MKKILVTVLSIALLLATGSLAFAQSQSDTVKTCVGDCPKDATGGTGGELSSIVDWDTKIVDGLKPALWGYLNNLSTAITNGSYSTGTWSGANSGTVYWCTYSIVDSYNLAGITGLTKAAHGAVVTMRQFWKGAASSGYIYVDYEGNKQSITSVKPGYAMFMESVAGTMTGNEHVNMVKEIQIDERGNGKLISQDSNSSAKSHTFPIDSYSVKGVPYPVRGFGGHQ